MRASEVIRVGGVTVSHPGKVWWPQQRITKLDLVRFYDAIAGWLLPWMKDRLLTAERCLEGLSWDEVPRPSTQLASTYEPSSAGSSGPIRGRTSGKHRQCPPEIS